MYNINPKISVQKRSCEAHPIRIFYILVDVVPYITKHEIKGMSKKIIL
jgi:hypothetical protein